MKSLYAAPALASLFLILSGCSDSAPDTRAADTKAVKDVETQWNADFASKDVDKIVSHYTADGVVMAAGFPAAFTPDARKAMFKGMFADPAASLSFQATSVEIAKSGDLAATRGTYKMTMTDPATKKPIADHGSYVTVYQKQADASWKALSDINVSEVPPPAPPAPKAAPARKKKR
jgi:ketosteroid isomerase-like protein